jgi:DNA helicase HerA-like ATPase
MESNEKKLIGYVTRSNSVNEFIFGVYSKEAMNISRHAYVVSYPADETRIGVISRIVKIRSGTLRSLPYVAKCKTLAVIREDKVFGPPERPVQIGDHVFLANDELLQLLFQTPSPSLTIGTLPYSPNVEFSIPLTEFSNTSSLIIGMTGSGKTNTAAILAKRLASQGFASTILDINGEYREKLELEADVKTIGHNFKIPFNSYFLSAVSASANLNTSEAHWLFSAYSHFGGNIGKAIEALSEGTEFRIPRITASKLAKALMLARESGILMDENLSESKSAEAPTQKGVTVFDLSQIDFPAQSLAICYLLQKLFDHAKEGSIFPIGPPIYVILEEAHLFVSNREIGQRSAIKPVESILRMGRSSGISICLVTQRPSFCEPLLLSNCGLQLIHRLINPNDIKGLSFASEYVSEEFLYEISHLNKGEIFVFDSKLNIPTIVRVK